LIVKYNPAIHKRGSIRLKGYDYSQAGLYFITICVQDRELLFGKIENGEMILNDAGEMVQTEWEKLPERFANIELHEFCVMPNHFHGILEIVSGAAVGATLVVARNGTAVPNEPIARNGTAVPNEPIARNGTAVPNEPIARNGTAVPNEPVAQNETAVPIEPIAQNETAVPNKPIDQNGIDTPNEPIGDTPGKNGTGQSLMGATTRRAITDGAITDGATTDGATKEGATTRVAPTAATVVCPTGKTVGDMIAAFKSITTVEYIRGVKNSDWQPFKGKLWQRNYYEHIIRDEQAYEKICDYITCNPGRWPADKFYRN
jgi:putative transposase